MAEPAVPPYRIATERLTVRCWNPEDAPRLKEAIDASLEHLQPWMPWAREEPRPVAEKVQLLRRFRSLFDTGEDFVYGIFSADESEVVGGTGLHTRVGDDAFEIGYWIRSSRAREGLATEAVAALTRVAFAVAKVDRVEIRVDPKNTASLGIPRKLGFREEATLRRRLPSRADAVVFSMFGDDVDGTPVAAARLEAYDAVGDRVL